MSPDQGDSQGGAGLPKLLENIPNQATIGPFGQEQSCHQPARGGSHDRQVVGVHLDQVPADQVGGEGHGIGLGDQVAVAEVDQRRILTGPRAENDPRVRYIDLAQELGQELQGKLSSLHAFETTVRWLLSGLVDAIINPE